MLPCLNCIIRCCVSNVLCLRFSADEFGRKKLVDSFAVTAEMLILKGYCIVTIYTLTYMVNALHKVMCFLNGWLTG